MKTLFFSIALLAISISLSAQSTITHTIQRGETAESVAQKYGISVGELKKANPDINEYMYVGMKLTIPEKETETMPVASQANINNNTQTEVNNDLSQSVPEVGNVDEYLQGSHDITGGLNFSWLMGRGDFSKSLKNFNFSVNVYVGYKYFVANYFALSAAAGWRMDQFYYEDIRVSGAPIITRDLVIHYITLPVTAHFHFPSNPKFKLFGGVKFNIPVGGRMKEKQGKDEEKTSWSDLKKSDSYNGLETDLEIGLSYNSFAIKYGFSISETFEKQKTQYVSLGVGI